MKLRGYTINVTFLDGPLASKSFHFNTFPITLGSADSDIVLSAPGVKAKHAKLFLADDQVQWETMANGDSQISNVKNGDSLTIAGITLTVTWQPSEKPLADTQSKCQPGTPEREVEEIFLETLKKL